jgi:hypothetical protein
MPEALSVVGAAFQRIAPHRLKFRPRQLAFRTFPHGHVRLYAAATSNISVSSPKTSSLAEIGHSVSSLGGAKRRHNRHHRYQLKRQHRR